MQLDAALFLQDSHAGERPEIGNGVADGDTLEGALEEGSELVTSVLTGAETRPATPTGGFPGLGRGGFPGGGGNNPGGGGNRGGGR